MTRTFTSTSDFLTNAVPGETFTPEPLQRSETTLRFMERLTDHHAQRERAAGGLVQSITTTHRGKADYIDHRPEYAYWTYLTTCPMFADDVVVTTVIDVGGETGTLDVTPAKRMSRKTLRDLHARLVAAYYETRHTDRAVGE